MSVTICYSTCWSCKFDHHFDPPQRHGWADAEEIDDARTAGLPLPTGLCACPCANADG